jgi:hypothetical protein
VGKRIHYLLILHIIYTNNETDKVMKIYLNLKTSTIRGSFHDNLIHTVSFFKTGHRVLHANFSTPC